MNEFFFSTKRVAFKIDCQLLDQPELFLVRARNEAVEMGNPAGVRIVDELITVEKVPVVRVAIEQKEISVHLIIDQAL